MQKSQDQPRFVQLAEQIMEVASALMWRSEELARLQDPTPTREARMELRGPDLSVSPCSQRTSAAWRRGSPRAAGPQGRGWGELPVKCLPNEQSSVEA